MTVSDSPSDMRKWVQVNVQELVQVCHRYSCCRTPDVCLAPFFCLQARPGVMVTGTEDIDVGEPDSESRKGGAVTSNME
ncbi:hypothetical protein Baya_10160 [Bagarius yarrelli]|uniref:Uncharacterized protein n=1 Tax=Bagarius yarrelli TaxID=175774 RepID=A0A556UF98_BAGYA|nr:hypothetical protein Baya_10160 [Bagarius yarrelli]